MDQTVNIPFSIRLDAGESRFNINVDKKFLDNPNRHYGFSSVTLTPDYYSRQAFKLDLDSEEELSAVTQYQYNVEVDYDKDAFDQHSYSATSSASFNTVLRNINKHYEQYKPEGLITPLLVFDWVHLGAMSKKVDKAEFYKNKISELYTAPFDTASLSADIPKAFPAHLDLNPYPFPTNPAVMTNIRIRLTLAPNVTIAFSNESLHFALGLADSQFTQKIRQQFRIQNALTNAYKTIICINPPTLGEIAYTTKIHTYPTDRFVSTENSMLTLTREKERKPSLLAAQINESLSTSIDKINLTLSLVHDAGARTFTWVYPKAQGLKVNVRMPPFISHKLGFGPVSVIKSDMTNTPYPEEIEINNVEAMAKVLVYDTGMVVVSLDQQASKQTYQFTNTVMAIMESDDAGVMTTKPGLEFSRVPVSYYNPNLEFVLSRFNETNEPVPLGWKVSAYIRGVLVGRL